MPGVEVQIRLAQPGDLDRINEIYNYYVRESTCTYQTAPETLESRIEWFHNRDARHPVVVAQESNRVVGWGAISPFKARSAYQHTGEVSVYVDHRFRHRGIGRGILRALLVHARKAGLHTLVAVISADQEPSVRAHEKVGFRISGRLKQAGRKFGRWLDVVYMQLMVDDI